MLFFFFLCTACQAAWFFWCEYKMFYFRWAESCSLRLITHHFLTATGSGSPLPLQQTHKKKKKLAEFTWCRQVKTNMSVIRSRCGTGRWCEVSVCVRVYVKMNASESTHFLYKLSLCSLSFLCALDYIIKNTPPTLNTLCSGSATGVRRVTYGIQKYKLIRRVRYAT